MQKTLTRKFSILYWLLFFIAIAPFYLFGMLFVKDILQTTEHEKLEIMVQTLQPTIALNLSFEQTQELEKIMHTILSQKNIQSVSISSSLFQKKLQKEGKRSPICHTYETKIEDPFKQNGIGSIIIEHSDEYLDVLYAKINKTLFGIFLFALFIFMLFYLSMKQELNALKKIADVFLNYSNNKQAISIQTQSKTAEIQTIATSANEMIEHISLYLHKLEAFNTELEKQVEEKVQKLRNQEKMMVHQSRQAAMGEMLESIAHQWRQPLNIIGLACVNLEMEYDLGIQNEQNFKEKMQIISTNIHYMSQTIDDFRDFLNPDREALRFDPKKSIEDVYEILAAQLQNNKIELTIKAQAPVELYGIENEFKQVLFVLINNSKDAIKALQKNFDNLNGKIEITLSNEENTTIISFCDNGGGIEENIIHSVFEPYFTTKFASSGTGIGLYMAKNIIESRMHGTIEVKNTKNGCCFTLRQRIEK